MKTTLLLSIILVIVAARKEETEDLDRFINSPGIWRYIRKRIGHSRNPNEPIDEEPKTVAPSTQSTNKEAPHDEETNHEENDNRNHKMKDQPWGSRADSLGNLCPYKANVSLIIKTKASMQAGAFFLKSFPRVTAEQCTEYCCYTQNCNLAVYENKEEHDCYLFNCGSPSKCLFAKHANFSTVVFPSHGLPSVSGEPGQQKTHENELEGLDNKKTTTQQSTTASPTPPPRHTVALFGKCYIDWNDKCADPNSQCLDGQCKCMDGYKVKYGFCRKECEPSTFECENKGQNGNVPDCIDHDLVCDGTSQCADGSDERQCEEIKNEPPKTHETASNIDEPASEGEEEEKPSTEPSSRPGPPKDVKVVSKSTDEVRVEWKESEASPCCPIMAYSIEFKKTNSDNVKKYAVQADTLSKVINNLEPNTSYTIYVRAYSFSSGASTRSEITVVTDASSVQQDKPENVSNTSSTSKASPTKLMTATPVPEVLVSSTVNTKTKLKQNNMTHERKGGNTVIVEEEVDKVLVASPTDSNEGPIVALALGLGITLMLLVFVGCRLRTVKRRIRKGRALHSNEADYLINGMYL